jgi:hypothetical protein
VLLDIHGAHPEAFGFQPFHQMSADETAGAANQSFLHSISLRTTAESVS